MARRHHGCGHTLGTDEFEVVDVSDWPLAPVEPAGRKQNKRWLRADDDVLWLFKEVTLQQLPNGDTWIKGENWAEKVVAEVGALLGLPVASVELATREGAIGSISRDLTHDKSQDSTGVARKSTLAMGNELLGGFIDGYEASKFHLVADYTIENVFTAFDSAHVAAPLGADQAIGANGWFAGYLLLDALVANTDRHHQNWGVLVDGARLTLAPSFDHASSLGFQLSDAGRGTELAQGIEKFAGRGRSRHAPGEPTFVELAASAALLSGTVLHWRHVLETTSPQEAMAVVDRIPAASMSQGARTFVQALIDVNWRRLTDALDAT